MIDRAYVEMLVEKLRVWKVQFAPGLTDEEVATVGMISSVTESCGRV